MKTYIEFSSASLKRVNEWQVWSLTNYLSGLCWVLHWEVSIWEKNAYKSATRSAARPDPYLKYGVVSLDL